MPRGHKPGSEGSGQSLWSAISGLAGDTTGKGGLRAQLMAAFGPSRRDPSRPDTSAAAKALGVSARTVQRYLTGEIKQPKPAARQALNKFARQARTTKKGRQRATDSARQRHRRGARLSVRGTLGVITGARDNSRWRTANIDLDPGQFDALLDAYERGGDKGAVGWLEENADTLYVDGLYVTDVGDYGLGDPYNTQLPPDADEAACRARART